MRASVLFTLLVGFLLLCACERTHSHPMSIVKRASILTSEIKRLEEECHARTGQYCPLNDLPLPVLRKWGDFQIQTPTRASFEDFDVQLLLMSGQFCVVAFPVRLPETFGAVWRDWRGKSYDVRYPWREAPASCNLPDRPRLIVE
jgi:hypothetical protein